MLICHIAFNTKYILNFENQIRIKRVLPIIDNFFLFGIAIKVKIIKRRTEPMPELLS